MKLGYKQTRHACYIGYVIQALTSILLPLLFVILQSDYSLSYKLLGGLSLLNFSTQLAVNILAVRLVEKKGYRASVILAHICVIIGLCLLGLSPLLPIPMFGALVLAVVVYACGSGVIELVISPLVDSLPAPESRKGANMALLHSFFCWGQVLVVAITTVLLAGIGSSHWQLLPFLWAIVPLCNCILFFHVPMTAPLTGDKRMQPKDLLSAPMFLAALALMICAGASELTVSQWASMFAEQGLGLSKMWGDLAGPCLFSLFMGIGRLVYGVLGSRINIARFMSLLSGLCTACYLIISLSTVPVASLAGLALCGFSVSILWPGTLSLSSARFPNGGTAMFAMLTMAGNIGSSVGPALAGAIADRASYEAGIFHFISNRLFSGGGEQLKTGIFFGAVFPLILFLILPVFRRSKS